MIIFLNLFYDFPFVHISSFNFYFVCSCKVIEFSQITQIIKVLCGQNRKMLYVPLRRLKGMKRSRAIRSHDVHYGRIVAQHVQSKNVFGRDASKGFYHFQYFVQKTPQMEVPNVE